VADNRNQDSNNPGNTGDQMYRDRTQQEQKGFSSDKRSADNPDSANDFSSGGSGDRSNQPIEDQSSTPGDKSGDRTSNRNDDMSRQNQGNQSNKP
jgi:hypothetical protein